MIYAWTGARAAAWRSGRWSVTPLIRTQVTQIHDKLTREAFTEKGDCVKQDTRKFTNVS